jgi:CheY-like chemotaxis protein
MPTLNTTILLVEDDPNDVLFIKMALEAVGVQNPVVDAKDGKEALDYLSGSGTYADRERYPLPCLILLDLKLPHLMGLDLLTWIRQRPEFDTVVVIVLTSSANPADINEAYRRGANAYVVKPSSFEKLRILAQSIKDFWLLHNHPAATLYS